MFNSQISQLFLSNKKSAGIAPCRRCSVSCKLYRDLRFLWLCCGCYSSEQSTSFDCLLWAFLSHPHALPSVLRAEKTYPQPAYLHRQGVYSVRILWADAYKNIYGVPWYTATISFLSFVLKYIWYFSVFILST